MMVEALVSTIGAIVRQEKILIAASLALMAILLASAAGAFDLSTWVMEIAPILIALPVMAMTWRRFPLTSLLYVLIFLHALVLIYGGHYTYARAPLGFWIEQALSLSRNPYDKIGHFMQGFVPFVVAREVLLRTSRSNRHMAAFLSICVAMAVSAWYELIEWAAALALGQGADEFLGTQGDPWDTQSDMFFAFIGALVAMLAVSRVHDRHIAHLSR